MRIECLCDRIAERLIVAFLLLQGRPVQLRHLIVAAARRFDDHVVDTLLCGKRLLAESRLPLQRRELGGVFCVEGLLREG